MKVPVACYGRDRACGKVLRWIEMPSDGISHGLCPECYKIEMQKVDDAFRRDERQQKEE